MVVVIIDSSSLTAAVSGAVEGCLVVMGEVREQDTAKEKRATQI